MTALAGSQSVANAGAFGMAVLGPAPSPHSLGIPNPQQLPIHDLVPNSPNSPSLTGPLDARGRPGTLSSISSSPSSREQSSSLDNSSSTVNHFGGITIEVRETADVNSLMRDLRLQGLATRHRQG